MKPSSIKKVFGIISYFPNEDIELRGECSRIFRELLFNLSELWPDVDIVIIAQNWKGFELPDINNKIVVYHYNNLDFSAAQKELRRRFLGSDYDYLITMSSNFIISSTDPQAFLDEIDQHPTGVGVARRGEGYLPFLAVSKSIYNQIDFAAPELVDLENNFLAAFCFTEFPDSVFTFTHELADGMTYDKHPIMQPVKVTVSEPDTASEVDVKEAPEVVSEPVSIVSTTEVDPNSPIDLIVTYVNCSDSNWAREFTKHTGSFLPPPERFRSWGTLKYLFRGIAKYMPFIRNVVLVVSRQSQVPVWIDTTKVRVVYHEDFIPKQYLPTFNSCTIESFFWNIPGLADRVLYLNDDMFPINMMQESDFFTGEIPHITFKNPVPCLNIMYRRQCRASIDLVTSALGLPEYKKDEVFLPMHIASPFTRASMDMIRSVSEAALPKTITVTRNSKNVNQYIYLYYYYFANRRVGTSVKFRYFDMNESTIKAIMSEIADNTNQMICLNDTDKIRDYARIKYQLNSSFERKFQSSCKYER